MFYYMVYQRLRLTPSNFLSFCSEQQMGNPWHPSHLKLGKTGHIPVFGLHHPWKEQLPWQGMLPHRIELKIPLSLLLFRGMIIQVISVSQQFFHRTLSSWASLLSASCEQGNTMLFLANSFAVYLYTGHIFSPLFTCSEEKPWFFEHSHLSSPEIQK